MAAVRRCSTRLDTMASGTGLSLALALTLAAFAGVALVDAQLGDGDILGAARDIAFDTGAKTEIGTPLGPVIGKVVESADGEHKHIQGGISTVAVVLDAIHFGLPILP